MSATRPISSDGVDRVLRGLGVDHLVAAAGDARLVTGAAGAFVVLPGGDAPAGAADRAARLAETTRTALAEHMSWVPFIDAVVVVHAGEATGAAATAVPLDLLGEVLVEGPPVIGHAILDHITDLVRAGALGGWRATRDTDLAVAGSLPDGGRIELCGTSSTLVVDPPVLPRPTSLDGVRTGPDVAPAT